MGSKSQWIWFFMLYIWILLHILFVAMCIINLFQGSCSRIWQRASYWDARPSSRRYLSGKITDLSYLGLSACWTEYTFWCAAMNTPFLYHAKIIAPLAGKIHGLIEAHVILALLQWNLRGSHAWNLLEVVALIFLLLLYILLKHTRTCRKGFHFSRKVWHA